MDFFSFQENSRYQWGLKKEKEFFWFFFLYYSYLCFMLHNNKENNMMLHAYVINYACEYVWFDILSQDVEILIIMWCIDQS